MMNYSFNDLLAHSMAPSSSPLLIRDAVAVVDANDHFRALNASHAPPAGQSCSGPGTVRVGFVAEIINVKKCSRYKYKARIIPVPNSGIN